MHPVAVFTGVEGSGQIDTRRANRGEIAQTDSGRFGQFVIGKRVKGVAGIIEYCDPPIFKEAFFQLKASDQQVFAADNIALIVGRSE